MGKIKHDYAGSHSSLGFYSLYEELRKETQYLYILKGGPGTGKSTLIRQVAEALAQKGFDMEWIHCPLDGDSLDGVLVPDLKTGIVDGTEPHIMEPKYPSLRDEIIDLGAYCQRLSDDQDEVMVATDEMEEAFSNAYKTFAGARRDHDRLEAIYVGAMDFHKADQVTQDLIETIFPHTVTPESDPVTLQRFCAAATWQGSQNFYENLTQDVTYRYIIKGRAGTGKSTLMKKIGQHAQKLGLSTHYYHCAFDPEGIDMTLIPSLNTAILDGTDPHVVEPTRDHDEIVDTLSLYVNPNVEVDQHEEIREAQTAYKYGMGRAANHLKKAQEARNKLIGFYRKATDDDAVERKTREILSQILR